MTRRLMNRGRIRKAGGHADGTLRAGARAVFLSESEKEILCGIAERSGVSRSGVVRALIRLHANDTLHIEQDVIFKVVVEPGKVKP